MVTFFAIIGVIATAVMLIAIILNAYDEGSIRGKGFHWMWQEKNNKKDG
jgi:hypothetical protein